LTKQIVEFNILFLNSLKETELLALEKDLEKIEGVIVRDNVLDAEDKGGIEDIQLAIQIVGTALTTVGGIVTLATTYHNIAKKLSDLLKEIKIELPDGKIERISEPTEEKINNILKNNLPEKIEIKN
jgi:hypothetical protein